jgi:hypothetical protein
MEEGDYESVDSNSSGEEGIGHRREQGKGWGIGGSQVGDGAQEEAR